MSTENQQTIDTYEKYGDAYIAQNSATTIDDPQIAAAAKFHQDYLIRQTTNLDKSAKIFEIGSAGGRDALFLKSLGFTDITTSDVVTPFLSALKANGFNAIKFNIITDNFPGQYDFILCIAVLIHLTKDETKSALAKIYDALADAGTFAFSIKESGKNDQAWKDFDQNAADSKRYFSYWTEDDIRATLAEIGFRNIAIKRSGAHSSWLYCSAQK